jgi:hypothetical protein
MDQFTENITVFLKPYIAEATKTGASRYEGILYQSYLYILVENTVLYKMDLSAVVDPNISYYFNNETINNGSNPVGSNMGPYYKYAEINSIISHTSNMVYHDPDLQDDPKFMAMATAKASEGAGFYFINTSIATVCTTVFPGLPSLQKSDSVELKVYNVGDGKLLINYTIFKKKLKVTYDIFYKIINVNCPLR